MKRGQLVKQNMKLESRGENHCRELGACIYRHLREFTMRKTEREREREREREKEEIKGVSKLSFHIRSTFRGFHRS